MFGKLFSSLVILVALVVAAAADISSTTGVEQLTLPADLSVNQTQSNAYIRFFAEKQGVALDTALAADTLGWDGTYGSSGALHAGSISEGTVVNSYVIHVDPVDYPGGIRAYTGTIDNIRVIEAVPTPAGVLLGMLGLSAAGLKLRKYV